MTRYTSLDLIAVGGRLKALRGRLALYQPEVVAEMGVPLRSYQSWEAGSAQTSWDNYKRLATYYSKRLGEEITPEFIMHGPAEVPPTVGLIESPEFRAAVAEAVERELEAQMPAILAKLQNSLVVKSTQAV